MNRARQEANKILNKLDITTVPVDVSYVAEKLQCKVIKIDPSELPSDFPCDASSFSGALIENNNGGHYIFVNKHHSLKRQKFTVAHEIGHLVLGSDNQVDCRDTMNDNRTPKEREANEFAGNLLMPKEWLEMALSHTTNNRDLANAFQVSEPAIEVRRRKLRL